MYTRNVSMKLKANSAKEFARTLENEVIPVLRKHKGFVGLPDYRISRNILEIIESWIY